MECQKRKIIFICFIVKPEIQVPYFRITVTYADYIQDEVKKKSNLRIWG